MHALASKGPDCSLAGAARAEARKRVMIEKVKRMVRDAPLVSRVLNKRFDILRPR